jgi:hypothetical protein
MTLPLSFPAFTPLPPSENLAISGQVSQVILVPTFRNSCSIASTHFSRTSESQGVSKSIISSAAFPFEVPDLDLPLVVQKLQMGGTGGN